MKKIAQKILLTTIVLGSMLASKVSAECYGDAADMYGCGAPKGATKRVLRQGDLEHFGENSAPVLPDVADSRQELASDVITPQESRRMLRSIILGNRNTLSQGTFTQAINQSGRAVRRSGSLGMGGGR